jgi:hypothetical protein
MANSHKVLDMIANEALAVAHEKATFISTVDRQYDDSFAKSGAHKTGSTLRVRSANQYSRRQGSRVMDVQDQNEATQTITLATQDGVDMRFNSAELTLDTNNPSEVERFSKRYIEPAMSVLVSAIDGDYLQAMTKKVYNVVGSPGTLVGASGDIKALFDARATLNSGLAPKESRAYQIDSVTMASIVNGKTGLFHPDAQVKKAFTEGYYGRAAGAEFYENERTYAHTNGSDHTTVTVNDASIASGDSVITTAGASATVGTVFTIANVNAVHPETKVSYGVLQQFVITAISGNDWTVSPAFISTGAKKNIDALPVTAAAITLHGSASTAYRQNIVYHKDAFAFVTADLPIMDDAHKCVRKTMDGLSLRVWMASDIRNDELLVRLDVLYGGKTLRPEWACRISN